LFGTPFGRPSGLPDTPGSNGFPFPRRFFGWLLFSAKFAGFTFLAVWANVLPCLSNLPSGSRLISGFFSSVSIGSVSPTASCCWLVFSCQPIGNWLRSSLCHCLFCRATFLEERRPCLRGSG